LTPFEYFRDGWQSIMQTVLKPFAYFRDVIARDIILLFTDILT